MAEFQEVMRQMARLHKCCDRGCIITGNNSQCPLYFIEDAPCDWIDATPEIPAAQIENAVMSWAAEHPEPIYPTWSKWLEEQDLLDARPKFISDEIEFFLAPKAFTAIPADIAEKLGIKPKEK